MVIKDPVELGDVDGNLDKFHVGRYLFI
jgi:hypothetical protein